MIRRSLLAAAALAASVFGQSPEPRFFTWHAFEFTPLESKDRELTLQLHFRTRNHFSTFNLLRGSVYGSQRLPRNLVLIAGYLNQNQEVPGDQEWARQQRIFASIARGWRTRRLQHSPRVQYDFLYAMKTPSYGRVRLGWQTEWLARVRPYAGAEEFIERAGVQRFRPRAGLRFTPASYLEADFVYMYDRIYRRGNTNRHILQTTLTFHRPGRD